MDIENLKYPIGKYKPGKITINMIEDWVADINSFPKRLNATLKGIKAKELKYSYRPDGWNIRQLVHHLADSHMNALIRFKLSLTEDSPVIKPYMEALWADMLDVEKTPIEASLKILEGVHARWEYVHMGMSITDYSKTFTHPEYGKKMNLAVTTGMYAWHGNHHLAHIKNALASKKEKWV